MSGSKSRKAKLSKAYLRKLSLSRMKPNLEKILKNKPKTQEDMLFEHVTEDGSNEEVEKIDDRVLRSRHQGVSFEEVSDDVEFDVWGSDSVPLVTRHVRAPRAPPWTSETNNMTTIPKVVIKKHSLLDQGSKDVHYHYKQDKKPKAELEKKIHSWPYKKKHSHLNTNRYPKHISSRSNYTVNQQVNRKIYPTRSSSHRKYTVKTDTSQSESMASDNHSLKIKFVQTQKKGEHGLNENILQQMKTDIVKKKHERKENVTQLNEINAVKRKHGSMKNITHKTKSIKTDTVKMENVSNKTVVDNMKSSSVKTSSRQMGKYFAISDRSNHLHSNKVKKAKTLKSQTLDHSESCLMPLDIDSSEYFLQDVNVQKCISDTYQLNYSDWENSDECLGKLKMKYPALQKVMKKIPAVEISKIDETGSVLAGKMSLVMSGEDVEVLSMWETLSASPSECIDTSEVTKEDNKLCDVCDAAEPSIPIDPKVLAMSCALQNDQFGRSGVEKVFRNLKFKSKFINHRSTVNKQNTLPASKTKPDWSKLTATLKKQSIYQSHETKLNTDTEVQCKQIISEVESLDMEESKYSFDSTDGDDINIDRMKNEDVISQSSFEAKLDAELQGITDSKVFDYDDYSIEICRDSPPDANYFDDNILDLSPSKAYAGLKQDIETAIREEAAEKAKENVIDTINEYSTVTELTRSLQICETQFVEGDCGVTGIQSEKFTLQKGEMDMILNTQEIQHSSDRNDNELVLKNDDENLCLGYCNDTLGIAGGSQVMDLDSFKMNNEIYNGSEDYSEKKVSELVIENVRSLNPSYTNVYKSDEYKTVFRETEWVADGYPFEFDNRNGEIVDNIMGHTHTVSGGVLLNLSSKDNDTEDYFDSFISQDNTNGSNEKSVDSTDTFILSEGDRESRSSVIEETGNTKPSFVSFYKEIYDENPNLDSTVSHKPSRFDDSVELNGDKTDIMKSDINVHVHTSVVDADDEGHVISSPTLMTDIENVSPMSKQVNKINERETGKFQSKLNEDTDKRQGTPEDEQHYITAANCMQSSNVSTDESVGLNKSDQNMNMNEKNYNPAFQRKDDSLDLRHKNSSSEVMDIGIKNSIMGNTVSTLVDKMIEYGIAEHTLPKGTTRPEEECAVSACQEEEPKVHGKLITDEASIPETEAESDDEGCLFIDTENDVTENLCNATRGIESGNDQSDMLNMDSNIKNNVLHHDADFAQSGGWNTVHGTDDGYGIHSRQIGHGTSVIHTGYDMANKVHGQGVNYVRQGCGTYIINNSKCGNDELHVRGEHTAPCTCTGPLTGPQSGCRTNLSTSRHGKGKRRNKGKDSTELPTIPPPKRRQRNRLSSTAQQEVEANEVKAADHRISTEFPKHNWLFNKYLSSSADHSIYASKQVTSVSSRERSKSVGTLGNSTTSVPTTLVSTTSVATPSAIPTTPVSTPSVPTTPVSTTPVSTPSAIPTTPVSTTPVSTPSAIPTTPVSTPSAIPITSVPTKSIVSTTSAIPTSVPITSAVPTTSVPTTSVPITSVATPSAIPTSVPITSAVPTTPVPTTSADFLSTQMSNTEFSKMMEASMDDLLQLTDSNYNMSVDRFLSDPFDCGSNIDRLEVNQSQRSWTDPLRELVEPSVREEYATDMCDMNMTVNKGTHIPVRRETEPTQFVNLSDINKKTSIQNIAVHQDDSISATSVLQTTQNSDIHNITTVSTNSITVSNVVNMKENQVTSDISERQESPEIGLEYSDKQEATCRETLPELTAKRMIEIAKKRLKSNTSTSSYVKTTPPSSRNVSDSESEPTSKTMEQSSGKLPADSSGVLPADSSGVNDDPKQIPVNELNKETDKESTRIEQMTCIPYCDEDNYKTHKSNSPLNSVNGVSSSKASVNNTDIDTTLTMDAISDSLELDILLARSASENWTKISKSNANFAAKTGKDIDMEHPISDTDPTNVLSEWDRMDIDSGILLEDGIGSSSADNQQLLEMSFSSISTFGSNCLDFNDAQEQNRHTVDSELVDPNSDMKPEANIVSAQDIERVSPLNLCMNKTDTINFRPRQNPPVQMVHPRVHKPLTGNENKTSTEETMMILDEAASPVDSDNKNISNIKPNDGVSASLCHSMQEGHIPSERTITVTAVCQMNTTAADTLTTMTHSGAYTAANTINRRNNDGAIGINNGNLISHHRKYTNATTTLGEALSSGSNRPNKRQTKVNGNFRNKTVNQSRITIRVPPVLALANLMTTSPSCTTISPIAVTTLQPVFPLMAAARVVQSLPAMPTAQAVRPLQTTHLVSIQPKIQQNVTPIQSTALQTVGQVQHIRPVAGTYSLQAGQFFIANPVNTIPVIQTDVGSQYIISSRNNNQSTLNIEPQGSGISQNVVNIIQPHVSSPVATPQTSAVFSQSHLSNNTSSQPLNSSSRAQQVCNTASTDTAYNTKVMNINKASTAGGTENNNCLDSFATQNDNSVNITTEGNRSSMNTNDKTETSGRLEKKSKDETVTVNESNTEEEDRKSDTDNLGNSPKVSPQGSSDSEDMDEINTLLEEMRRKEEALRKEKEKMFEKMKQAKAKALEKKKLKSAGVSKITQAGHTNSTAMEVEMSDNLDNCNKIDINEEHNESVRNENMLENEPNMMFDKADDFTMKRKFDAPVISSKEFNECDNSTSKSFESVHSEAMDMSQSGKMCQKATLDRTNDDNTETERVAKRLKYDQMTGLANRNVRNSNISSVKTSENISDSVMDLSLGSKVSSEFKHSDSYRGDSFTDSLKVSETLVNDTTDTYSNDKDTLLSSNDKTNASVYTANCGVLDMGRRVNHLSESQEHVKTILPATCKSIISSTNTGPSFSTYLTQIETEQLTSMCTKINACTESSLNLSRSGNVPPTNSVEVSHLSTQCSQPVCAVPLLTTAADTVSTSKQQPPCIDDIGIVDLTVSSQMDTKTDHDVMNQDNILSASSPPPLIDSVGIHPMHQAFTNPVQRNSRRNRLNNETMPPLLPRQKFTPRYSSETVQGRSVAIADEILHRRPQVFADHHSQGFVAPGQCNLLRQQMSPVSPREHIAQNRHHYQQPQAPDYVQDYSRNPDQFRSYSHMAQNASPSTVPYDLTADRNIQHLKSTNLSGHIQMSRQNSASEMNSRQPISQSTAQYAGPYRGSQFTEKQINRMSVSHSHLTENKSNHRMSGITNNPAALTNNQRSPRKWHTPMHPGEIEEIDRIRTERKMQNSIVDTSISRAHNSKVIPRKIPKGARPIAAHVQHGSVKETLKKMNKSLILIPRQIEQTCPYRNRWTPQCSSPFDIRRRRRAMPHRAPHSAHSQKPFGIAGRLIVSMIKQPVIKSQPEVKQQIKQSHSQPATPTFDTDISCAPQAASTDTPQCLEQSQQARLCKQEPVQRTECSQGDTNSINIPITPLPVRAHLPFTPQKYHSHSITMTQVCRPPAVQFTEFKFAHQQYQASGEAKTEPVDLIDLTKDKTSTLDTKSPMEHMDVNAKESCTLTEHNKDATNAEQMNDQKDIHKEVNDMHICNVQDAEKVNTSANASTEGKAKTIDSNETEPLSDIVGFIDLNNTETETVIQQELNDAIEKRQKTADVSLADPTTSLHTTPWFPLSRFRSKTPPPPSTPRPLDGNDSDICEELHDKKRRRCHSGSFSQNDSGTTDLLRLVPLSQNVMSTSDNPSEIALQQSDSIASGNQNQNVEAQNHNVPQSVDENTSLNTAENSGQINPDRNVCISQPISIHDSNTSDKQEQSDSPTLKKMLLASREEVKAQLKKSSRKRARDDAPPPRLLQVVHLGKGLGQIGSQPMGFPSSSDPRLVGAVQVSSPGHPRPRQYTSPSDQRYIRYPSPNDQTLVINPSPSDHRSHQFPSPTSNRLGHFVNPSDQMTVQYQRSPDQRLSQYLNQSDHRQLRFPSPVDQRNVYMSDNHGYNNPVASQAPVQHVQNMSAPQRQMGNMGEQFGPVMNDPGPRRILSGHMSRHRGPGIPIQRTYTNMPRPGYPPNISMAPLQQQQQMPPASFPVTCKPPTGNPPPAPQSQNPAPDLQGYREQQQRLMSAEEIKWANVQERQQSWMEHKRQFFPQQQPLQHQPQMQQQQQQPLQPQMQQQQQQQQLQQQPLQPQMQQQQQQQQLQQQSFHQNNQPQLPTQGGSELVSPNQTQGVPPFVMRNSPQQLGPSMQQLQPHTYPGAPQMNFVPRNGPMHNTPGNMNPPTFPQGPYVTNARHTLTPMNQSTSVNQGHGYRQNMPQPLNSCATDPNTGYQQNQIGCGNSVQVVYQQQDGVSLSRGQQWHEKQNSTNRAHRPDTTLDPRLRCISMESPVKKKPPERDPLPGNTGGQGQQPMLALKTGTVLLQQSNSGQGQQNITTTQPLQQQSNSTCQGQVNNSGQGQQNITTTQPQQQSNSTGQAQVNNSCQGQQNITTTQPLQQQSNSTGQVQVNNSGQGQQNITTTQPQQQSNSTCQGQVNNSGQGQQNITTTQPQQQSNSTGQAQVNNSCQGQQNITTTQPLQQQSNSTGQAQVNNSCQGQQNIATTQPPPGISILRNIMPSGVSTQSLSNDTADDSAPHLQQIHGTCVICGKFSLYLCSTCKKIWYCSPQCQLNHWQVHSEVCTGSVT